MIEHIFVYGTLRKNSRHRMAQVLSYHTEYVGEAVIQGQLYQVTTYPALIESSNQHDKVSGELYKITDHSTLFPLLDEYEECTENFPEPHEYIRKTLPVTLIKTGETIVAWVYVYNWAVSPLQRIG